MKKYFVKESSYGEEVIWWRVWLLISFVGVLLISGCNIWYWNTESGQRQWKSFQSNNNGGLVRSVDVYDQGGNLLRTYTGKIDIQDTEYGNKVLFDLNGKRIVIYNATVITEEK